MIFETTDIKLGAALLSEIPDAKLKGISDRHINSKRILILDFPDASESEVKKLIDSYARKELLVRLFYYNFALNIIRDALRNDGVTNGKRGQTTGVGSGKV